MKSLWLLALICGTAVIPHAASASDYDTTTLIYFPMNGTIVRTGGSVPLGIILESNHFYSITNSTHLVETLLLDAKQYIGQTLVKTVEASVDAYPNFYGNWGTMLEVETPFYVYHTIYNFTATTKLWKDGEIKASDSDFSQFRVLP